MLIVEYKILFELRILHDYYLINSKGESVFPMEEKDWAGLQRKLRYGRYDMSRDFDFILSREERKKLRNYKLKMVKTPLGFFVGMEVKPESLENGDKRYRPFIPPAGDAVLVFGLKPLNTLFGNMTNIPLSRNANKIFEFSNRGERVENTLSSPVPPIAEGKRYQMGELAADENGAIRYALEDNGDEAAKWSAEPLSGNGFVHHGDRNLDTGENWYKSWRLDFEKPASDPFGMIRIYFRTGNPAMDLINDEGYLVTRRDAGQARPAHPVFELRFLSRPTYWRYFKKDGFEREEVNKIKAVFPNVLAPYPANGGEQHSNVEYFSTLLPRYYSEALTGFDDSGPEISNAGNGNNGNGNGGSNGNTASPPLGNAAASQSRFTFFTNARPGLLNKERGRVYSDIYFTQANPIPL